MNKEKFQKKVIFYKFLLLATIFALLFNLVAYNLFYVLKAFNSDRVKIGSETIFNCPDGWLCKKEKSVLWIKNRNMDLVFWCKYDPKLSKVNKKALFDKLKTQVFYIRKFYIGGLEIWEFLLRENKFEKNNVSIINYFVFPLGLKLEYFGKIAEKDRNLFLFINNLEASGNAKKEFEK